MQADQGQLDEQRAGGHHPAPAGLRVVVQVDGGEAAGVLAGGARPLAAQVAGVADVAGVAVLLAEQPRREETRQPGAARHGCAALPRQTGGPLPGGDAAG